MVIDISKTDKQLVQQYLQAAVAPRPVCFASTISAKGMVNLSPFSYFNFFSADPPVVIFSPLRRMRDNTIKHTLENVLEVPEVVINIVDDSMVYQQSLSSCEYPKNVNEFIKAGFTEEKADKVRPPMVKESKVKMECVVTEVKALGKDGGAGNLIICEVVCMHIAEEVLDKEKKIDPFRLKLVARLGGDWYCRVDANNLFRVEKPNRKLGIGFDQLPEEVRTSPHFTSNHLAMLANCSEIPGGTPGQGALRKVMEISSGTGDPYKTHPEAANLLDKGMIEEAWGLIIKK